MNFVTDNLPETEKSHDSEERPNSSDWPSPNLIFSFVRSVFDRSFELLFELGRSIQAGHKLFSRYLGRIFVLCESLYKLH